MIVEIILLTFVLLTILHCKIRYSRNGRLIELIQGPKAYPLIGNVLGWQLEHDKIFIKVRTQNKLYKRINRNWLFGVPVVQFYDPSDVEIILSNSKYNNKSFFYFPIGPWLAGGLLLSNGSKWHKRRRIITPAFHFDILKPFCRIFSEHSLLLVNELSKVVGQEVDIAAYIGRSVLNTLCETTMGIDTKRSEESNEIYRKAVHDASKQIVWRLARPWLLVPWLYSITEAGRNHNKTLKTLHEFTLKVIRQKRSEQSKKNIDYEEFNDFNKKRRLAMLDLLLLSEIKGEIDEQGIQEEVDTFMFEGHDTITLSLVYTLMLIANHQDIQNNIFNELLEVLGEDQLDNLSMTDLQKLKYLERVIKESQQLYPSVPAISRKLKDDLEIKDYVIPAGSVCMIHVFDLHRDSKNYKNPDKFDPDRFLPENSENRHPFAYIPFSAGPRNCIGQKYAMLEAKCIVATIVRSFVLMPVTRPEDVVHCCDLVLRFKDPIMIRFERRK